MKRFEIPMVIMSLAGLCFLACLDVPAAHADFVFGQPVDLKTVVPQLDGMADGVSCLSFDGLEMYINSQRPGGYGDWDFWVLKRPSIDADWGPPQNLGASINSPKEDSGFSISADGLAAYFASNRPGGYGSFDIYVITRPTKIDPWQSPVNVGSQINSSAADTPPSVSPDGLELYFVSWRAGGYGDGDIYVARRETTTDPWGKPSNLGMPVNSAYGETQVTVSTDGLLLFFADNWSTTPRPGGYGNQDIWMARRVNRSTPWQTPVNLGPLFNGPAYDWSPRISPDGHTFYFSTALTLDTSTWTSSQATILPIVDFNGDGQVEGRDLLTMIDELGGSDAICDIGPYAWGDGMVDAKDLTVLAGYIGKEIEDPTLVAHWAFDETEGSVAMDSAGDCEGTLTGGSTWQPQGGMVGGALKCDGVTGCVVTKTIPNLGTGPFSVIAWVKGGAPGQIILSHNGTTDWLLADPLDGRLMSKLTIRRQPLAEGSSGAVITDGKWHRIALVCDGMDQILYTDGREVLRDVQPDITVSDGQIMIGAGMKPGNLWSGLIDDVRIYNRVVRP